VIVLGTHAAIGFLRDGKHWCVERTLDGYILPGAIRTWIDHVINNSGEVQWLPSEDDIGAGGVEENDEREHDQEYFAFIDLDNKVLYVDANTLLELAEDPMKLAELVFNLYVNAKWKMDYADDCGVVAEKLGIGRSWKCLM
jgi:hypothetical protein